MTTGTLMASQTVLLAETDSSTLDLLPRLSMEHLPHVVVDVCTSAEELCQTRDLRAYDTITTSPILFQAYRFLKRKTTYPILAPILVTTGEQDCRSAYQVLQKDAFDFIEKPIVPHVATTTVREALWHNQILKLLASRERAVFTFQEHMEVYPQDLHAETHMTTICDLFDRTVQTLKTGTHEVISNEQERALLDMLATLEQVRKQRALDQLLSRWNIEPSQ